MRIAGAISPERTVGVLKALGSKRLPRAPARPAASCRHPKLEGGPRRSRDPSNVIGLIEFF